LIKEKYKLRHTCTEADPEFSQNKNKSYNRAIKSIFQQILAVTELHSLALDPFSLNNSFVCCSIFLLEPYTMCLIFHKYLCTSRQLVLLSYGIKTSESFLVLFMHSSHKVHEMNTLWWTYICSFAISSSTTKIY
jgi:hypothetical protein